jgi:hypothetical protein
MEERQEEIFQKKQIIYSDNLGVCRVEEVTKLSAKKGDPILYYGLRSLYNKEKTAYVPVHGHEVLLRELISLEEALAIKQEEDFKKKPEIVRNEVNYVISHVGIK